MNYKKNGKASGSSGVVSEIVKAAGEPCLNFLITIFIDDLFESKLPEEWMLSSLVVTFKGEGDFLSPNLYRGIKLLEHDFKLNEKVLDGWLCNLVGINKMQYRLMPGNGTVDTVFILRRLTEKFRSKNEKLFFVLFDLEKAFD